MGVSGCVGLLRQRGPSFREPFSLRDTSLIIDATQAMYWMIKRHYIGNNNGNRFDLAGWSMIDLSHFWRHLLKRLVERNVKPIIVYSGARVNERSHGMLASKCHFLEASCRASLRRFNSFNYTIDMPDLAINALKEVVNEFGFEQVHQSVFESHQVIARLAQKHKCPVLTSHSDFIFLDLPHGYIWSDDLDIITRWPVDDKPIETYLYYNDRMLDHFKLGSRYKEALTSLYVLCRDDFVNAHYHALNEILGLERTQVAFGPNINDRKKTRRLIHLLQNWPKHLTSIERVYKSLTSLPSAGCNLRRDFDGIWISYDTNEPLGKKDDLYIEENFMSTNQIRDLNDALTRRECSADFILNLNQKNNYHRVGIEDIQGTWRSTFSISDRTRQYLTAQLNLQPNPRLFDRCKSALDYRSLAPMNLAKHQLSEGLTKARLFSLFHFDEDQLIFLSKHLSRHLVIDNDSAWCLALMLLLARFGHRIAFRETFDNSPPKGRTNSIDARSNNLTNTNHNNAAATPELSVSQSGSGKSNRVASIYLQPDLMNKFTTAIINSFVYHSTGQSLGDTQRSDILAEHRVMKQRLNELKTQSLVLISRSDNSNLYIKHLIEMLNSVIHSYKEINSLFNFVGPNIMVRKYYDGLLIYRIMSKWSNSLRDHLLPIDDTISDMMR